MNVSTRLRTDISTMYEYSKESNPLNTRVSLPNIEIQQDYLPVKYPFIPRICEERGYFLIWIGDNIDDSDLIKSWMKSSDEPQWISYLTPNKIQKGVALIYPYNDEIIIGSVKLAGYMRVRSSIQNRAFLRLMWDNIIEMFGDKTIICPSGMYFEKLHLEMNQKKIPHEAYHWKLMQQHQFKRVGEYWIR